MSAQPHDHEVVWIKDVVARGVPRRTTREPRPRVLDLSPDRHLTDDDAPEDDGTIEVVDDDAPLDAGHDDPEVIEHDVAVEEHKIRVREEARRRVKGATRAPMPPVESLAVAVDGPRERVGFRVDDLWIDRGRVLLSAQNKVGKSTLALNLMRSLVDGDDFLGRFHTKPVERNVLLLDNELDRDLLLDNLGAQGIRNLDRIQFVSLRGSVSSFDLTDAVVRRDWAQAIREADTEVLILDCLRPVLDAIGLSEDKDAGRFLTLLDELLREADVPEALINHHAGHTNGRARGDSRLRDWPDVEWFATRATEDMDSARYFRAYGRRGVDLAESQLLFDAETGRMTLSAETRRESMNERVVAAVETLLDAHTEGMTGRQITEQLGSRFAEKAITGALKSVRESNAIPWRKGPKNSYVYGG